MDKAARQSRERSYDGGYDENRKNWQEARSRLKSAAARRRRAITKLMAYGASTLREGERAAGRDFFGRDLWRCCGTGAA